MRTAGSAASTYRRETLSYITAKVVALHRVVDELDRNYRGAQLATSVLNTLWDDHEFAGLLVREGLGHTPTALRDASALSSRVQDLRSAATDQRKGRAEAHYLSEPDRAARALLAEYQAPDRVHALLDKLAPARQWAVAKLMVAVEDYSQRFIAALLGATPETERVLVLRLGQRSKALQEQLAQQEHILADLHRREQDLRERCVLRSFQLAVAKSYVRGLFANPLTRDWLFARRPHEAATLTQCTGTGTGVHGEGRLEIPGRSPRFWRASSVDRLPP